MRRFLTCAAVAVTASLTSASQSPTAASPGLLVTTAELAASLKDPSLVILHVADRASVYEEAHIPGARMLRYGDFAIDGPDSLGSELPPAAQAETGLRSRRRLEYLPCGHLRREPGRRGTRVLHARRDGPSSRGAARRRPPRLAGREPADGERSGTAVHRKAPSRPR